jgi:hypothetical protein
MAYNNINKYKRYLSIIEIVNEHYVDGITTYMGIYKKYVEPVYYISYKTFMDIVNTPNVKEALKKEIEKVENNKDESPCE